MIDRSTIDRIMDAADIVEVVSEFVTLRKAGVNYKGLCPFHNEKTPSFVVSPAKGLCKCFSCGKGGNAVHFIMEHEQMTYPEALRWLARKYHIEIKERELTPDEIVLQNKRESLFIVNEWARDYFQNTLFTHPDGQSIGMAYFRSRGFRDDIIRKFQLGYSLPQRDALARSAVEKGFNKDFLVETGLCYQRDDGTLNDRYHGRVIFPVHTLSGKVVAFGGRILKTGEKVAKYVNSPESAIYHKSNELYGIYFAKQAIVKNDRCYLVEGYTDVISMHQSGIENVVASSGTSLTPGQIRLLHRFTENITILYDGDMAGIKASLRGIDMLLEEGLNIKVLLLPDGDDPDSFARKHTAEEYCHYIDEHQVDFIRFKTNLLLEECKNDPVRRAQLITNIIQSISVIPNPIVRSLYTKECSRLLEIDENLLVDEISTIVAQRKTSQRTAPEEAGNEKKEAEKTKNEAAEKTDEPTDTATQPTLAPATRTKNDKREAEERELIRLIVRYGEERIECDDENGQKSSISVIDWIDSELKSDEISFENPLYGQMLQEAVANETETNFKAERFFSLHPQPEISILATSLSNDAYPLSKIHTKTQTLRPERERLTELIPRTIIGFKLTIVREKMASILKQIENPQNSSDMDKCEKFMSEYMNLKDIEKALAQWLDRVLIV